MQTNMRFRPPMRPHPEQLPHTRDPRAHTLRTRDGDARATRTDSGFTLVELLVIMVILAVLLAIAIPTFLGARKSTSAQTARAAAATYQTSIEQFRLDHSARVPIAGTADWMSDTSNHFEYGPVDQWNRPYMKIGIPEVVATGDVQLIAGSTTSGGNPTSRITYLPGAGTPPTTYTLSVETLDQGAWTKVCEISNAGGPQTPC